jgi:protein-disulfide isomerase
VREDATEGVRLGVDSTPTLFINGRKIKGALEPELLTNAVILAKSAP